MNFSPQALVIGIFLSLAPTSWAAGHSAIDEILLLGIFPRSENLSAQRGKLAMINQALRRQADEKDVFWVDFGHRFLNDDGTMPREL
ncbi:MAG TPA: hypothetical protein VNH84_21850, partial [Candidatus Saccharimonadales bacterium]|nr:hypothetical protein [Candidatus Saccharimonadales bacterium]